MRPSAHDGDAGRNRELYRRARRLALRTLRAVRTHLAGAYGSVFHGPGLAFSGLRRYEPGDEVRRIDWRALARFRTPYVREFVEERELRVFLLVDVSRSMDLGTAGRTKRMAAEETAAALALAAAARGDRAGALALGAPAGSVRLREPGRGLRWAMRLTRDILAAPARPGPTDLRPALRLLEGVRPAIVFLISDMLFDPPLWTEDVARALARAGARHELAAVAVSDPAEQWDAPLWAAAGRTIVASRDPESGRRVELGAERMAPALKARARRIDEALTRAGAGRVYLSTTDDPVLALRRYFRAVERRRSSRAGT
jgi:uncharacterized protein (DUF58 family)